jgi:hypothetical protein
LQQLLVQYVFSKLTQAVFLADDLAEIFIAWFYNMYSSIWNSGDSNI